MKTSLQAGILLYERDGGPDRFAGRRSFLLKGKASDCPIHYIRFRHFCRGKDGIVGLADFENQVSHLFSACFDLARRLLNKKPHVN